MMLIKEKIRSGVVPVAEKDRWTISTLKIPFDLIRGSWRCVRPFSITVFPIWSHLTIPPGHELYFA